MHRTDINTVNPASRSNFPVIGRTAWPFRCRRTCRRPRCSWGGGRGSCGLGRSASWSAGRRAGRRSGRRAGPRRCACCRCEVVAAAYTADRTSGCRSRRSSPRTRTGPERSAVSRAMSPAPSRVAARRMIDSRPESSAVRVPPPAARLDGPDGPEEKERTPDVFTDSVCPQRAPLTSNVRSLIETDVPTLQAAGASSGHPWFSEQY